MVIFLFWLYSRNKCEFQPQRLIGIQLPEIRPFDRNSACIFQVVVPLPISSFLIDVSTDRYNSITRGQYNGRPPAISGAKCWYGRLLITLHGHYGRPFCLINLNILPLLLQIFLAKSVIFNTCKQRSRLLDNHRIWLRHDPHNNNVISSIIKTTASINNCFNNNEEVYISLNFQWFNLNDSKKETWFRSYFPNKCFLTRDTFYLVYYTRFQNYATNPIVTQSRSSNCLQLWVLRIIVDVYALYALYKRFRMIFKIF
jgi:hypothetical protein